MSKKHKTLKEEIQQTTYLEPEVEAYLNLIRTADVLHSEANALMRQFETTQPQYNVLRILRGAGEAGLCGRDIHERMVTRDSDMTRLLDNLERKELVTRVRCEQDRRVVHAHVTQAGLDLLERMEKPMLELKEDQFKHISPNKLRSLSRLLEEVRNRP